MPENADGFSAVGSAGFSSVVSPSPPYNDFKNEERLGFFEREPFFVKLQ